MSCSVYMIKCLDETVAEIYIGSTCNYKQRQNHHKYNCNNPSSINHNSKLYRFIRSKGGFAKFTFKVIEECSNEDKLKLEKMFIEMYNPELNTYKFYFDKKRYFKEYNNKNKEKLKEYHKEYNEINKEKLKEYHKDYNEINKEKLKEYRKEYNIKNRERIAKENKDYVENNKDKIAAYRKEYREKNKEKRKEKNKEIICCRVCRCEIRKTEFKRHCRTKKHISNQT